MSEHALKPHVLRQARRLDLAGDVEVAQRRSPPPTRRSTSSSLRRRRGTSAASCTSGGNGRTRRARREPSAPSTTARDRDEQPRRREQRPCRPRHASRSDVCASRSLAPRRLAHAASTRTRRSPRPWRSRSARRSAVLRADQCGITTTLNSTEPRIAPTVFAAYTRPTSRPASCPGRPPRRSPAGSSPPTGTAAGKTATSDAHRVDLERDPRTRRQRRIDRPVGKRLAPS